LRKRLRVGLPIFEYGDDDPVAVASLLTRSGKSSGASWESEEYRAAARDLIAKHHGEYVVRGGELEVIAGEWRPKRLIILRFPSKAAVRAYFDDPVYHELGELRQRALQSDIVMAEGV
jgi:uncharacterized protein (DUF1330 family)